MQSTLSPGRPVWNEPSSSSHGPVHSGSMRSICPSSSLSSPSPHCRKSPMQSIGSSGPPLLVGDPLSLLLVIGSVPPLIVVVLVDIESVLVVDIVVLVAVVTPLSELPPLAGSSST